MPNRFCLYYIIHNFISVIRRHATWKNALYITTLRSQRTTRRSDLLTQQECPFDHPPALLVWQLLSALHRWLFPLIAIHTDQLDSSVALTFPQCIRFMGFLINGPLRALGRMAAQGDSESLKRRFHQRSFGESYRLQEVAQRYSWAADLYHPLLDTVFSFSLEQNCRRRTPCPSCGARGHCGGLERTIV